jgi:hypothetical protein
MSYELWALGFGLWAMSYELAIRRPRVKKWRTHPDALLIAVSQPMAQLIAHSDPLVTTITSPIE